MAIKKERKKSVRITVTPNIEYCIKVLKRSVKKIDDEESLNAIRYIEAAAKGETQVLRGRGCPTFRKIQKEL